MSLLSGILFIMLGLGADGAPPVVQLRTPPPSMMGLPSLPASLEGYSYIIMKLGPLQLTRKGLSVASTSASLTFSVSYIYCISFNLVKDVLDALYNFSFVFLFLYCSFLHQSFHFISTTLIQLSLPFSIAHFILALLTKTLVPPTSSY